jgi:arginine decarboxylase
LKDWTIRDSLDLYDVLDWGSGFFAINDTGDVEVRPKTDDARSIDLLEPYEQGLEGYTHLSGQA